MKIIVVVPGTYNDERGQPVACAKGDILTTASGYGQALLNEGFAVSLLPVEAEPAPEPRPEPEPTLGPAPKPKRQKKATD